MTMEKISGIPVTDIEVLKKENINLKALAETGVKIFFKQLFDDMERKKDLIELLNSTELGEGIRVFIGSENKLFSLSGSSLVFSPYTYAEGEILGAIGVIGPTRLNYGRIVPIVNYTAQTLSKLIEKNKSQS